MKSQIFNSFNGLWQILLKILKDLNAGQIYFLIDALYECNKSSCGFQQAFLKSLTHLFFIQLESETFDVKLLLTCQSESDILDELNDLDKSVHIDSDKINADLFKYIQTRVNELLKKKNYSQKLQQDIQNVLFKKAEGTFLWVSLILNDIFKTTVTF